MPSEEQDRSRYYQAIAAAFVRRRGGPALLSPNDQAVIARWEALGIPLEAALEGIQNAFNYHGIQAPVRRNIRALAACSPQVLKAFERLRDRNVGRQVKVRPRAEKRKEIAAEARLFLERLPAEAAFLKEPYEEVLGLVSRERPDEEALERVEARIEGLLVKHAPSAEREAVRRAVEEEFPALRGTEEDEVFRLKLIKSLRAAYRVPYVTFPYY